MKVGITAFLRLYREVKKLFAVIPRREVVAALQDINLAY